MAKTHRRKQKIEYDFINRWKFLDFQRLFLHYKQKHQEHRFSALLTEKSD
ncbi:MAG: hypothetical protein IKC03_10625 [Oscillospiraceae bacterium]|nr:hypothetical protein [Oscillospiraceae bacterium]